MTKLELTRQREDRLALARRLARNGEDVKTIKAQLGHIGRTAGRAYDAVAEALRVIRVLARNAALEMPAKRGAA